MEIDFHEFSGVWNDSTDSSKHGHDGSASVSASVWGMSQIVWIVLFSIMLSVAILGNLIVIWIILAHGRMRTVTNYFLFNLSVGDLTMALLNGAPNSHYMIGYNWIFGRALCVVNNFVANFTVTGCVLTMMAIAIDRWMAIIRPLEPRMSKGAAWRAIGVIWMCSAALAIPCILYSEILDYQPGLVLCVTLWPGTSKPMESSLELAYNVFFMLITYVLPMTVMGICYGSISKELWRQKQIGEVNERQLQSVISKRKVVRMFIVVVVVFGVSWLPYHVYFLYGYIDKDIVNEAWVQHLYLSFYFLAMSTAMINPILYYFMNIRFRTYINHVLCNNRCCCRCRRQVPGPEVIMLPETPPLYRHNRHSTTRQCGRGLYAYSDSVPLPSEAENQRRPAINSPITEYTELPSALEGWANTTRFSATRPHVDMPSRMSSRVTANVNISSSGAPSRRRQYLQLNKKGSTTTL